MDENDATGERQGLPCTLSERARVRGVVPPTFQALRGCRKRRSLPRRFLGQSDRCQLVELGDDVAAQLIDELHTHNPGERLAASWLIIEGMKLGSACKVGAHDVVTRMATPGTAKCRAEQRPDGRDVLSDARGPSVVDICRQALVGCAHDCKRI